MKQYGIVIERWHWTRRLEVRMWLVHHFGAHGDRWGEEPNYGVENMWMDEDVYIMYKLRWE